MSAAKASDSLQKCSKADLIWIIHEMQKHLLWPTLDYILIDLRFRKDMARIDRAEKISKISEEKYAAFFDLIKPYEDKTWADVPDDIAQEAARLLKEAGAAECEWMKLMGIGGKNGKVH